MNARAGRRQQILETLARELETHPGSRITTARLAQALSVSEAALYRHFASKAQMFEALIGFAEDAVFGLFNQVMSEQDDALVRTEHLALVVLRFAERNPGIARVLVGDALVGENERLRRRVAQFFARIETQFRQVAREHAAFAGVPVSAAPGLMLVVISGRLARFVRSEFADSPLDEWDAHWALVAPRLFAG